MKDGIEQRPFFAITDFPELCRFLAVICYAAFYSVTGYEGPVVIDLLALVGALSLGDGIGISLRKFAKWLPSKPAVG